LRLTSRDREGAGERIDSHPPCPLPDGRGSFPRPLIRKLCRAPPLFAVGRGLQQSLNQVFPCIGRLVVEEPLNLLRRGRKTVQVIRGPANERQFIRARGWIQTGLAQAFSNKGVDRMRRAGRFRDGRLANRFERPQVGRLVAAVGPFVAHTAAGFNQDAVCRRREGPLGFADFSTAFFIGPDGAGGDPLANAFDLLRIQPVVFLGRHFEALPLDREIERALRRLAGHDSRLARFAPLIAPARERMSNFPFSSFPFSP